MNVLIGLQETIVTLLISFIILMIYFGNKISNKIYSEELEETTRSRDESQKEYGYFDEDSDSHYYSAIFKNGWRIAFIICAALFNIIYPTLNLILQIQIINLEYLEANFNLYAISGISFYLIIKGLLQLKNISTSLDSFNLGNKSKKKKKQIIYFSVRQFLIYSIAINFCLLNRNSDSDIIFKIVIFFTILTIDDWMLLFKYLDIIKLNRLKKIDLYKLLSYNIIIPIAIFISIINGIRENDIINNSNIDLGSNIYSIWIIIGLPFFILWLELIYENIRLIKDLK